MRDLINLVNEAGLPASTLAKHNGKYLDTLIGLADRAEPLQVVPDKQAQYGKTVTITADALQQLKSAQAAFQNTGVLNLPRSIQVRSELSGDQAVAISLGNIFKDARFKGGETGEAKTYNAGHLNELLMGMAVAAKFLNIGNPVNAEQVLAMGSQINMGISGKTMQFTMQATVNYPEKNSKKDTMNFRAVVPLASAQEFAKFVKAGALPRDLNALLNGAVKYANSAERPIKACALVRNDTNSNVIDVVSDGTSDAKSTKADLKIGIDGKSVALLSLKTRSSDTLGQISGITFENLVVWFQKCFNVNISPYKNLFDPKLDRTQVYQNIYRVYDTVVVPQLKLVIEKQSPATETQIVRHLANAALFFARGESMEDVEVVKLDDNATEGNYKILRFTDTLYDAMKLLDLDLAYSTRDKGRTIKILVKPDASAPVKGRKQSNLLCQFRTQIMGDYMRHYFETGTMLEQLTHVHVPLDIEDEKQVARLTRSPADVGRARRSGA